jgi:hypothetical protein
MKLYTCLILKKEERASILGEITIYKPINAQGPLAH